MTKHYSENFKENYISGNTYAITGGGSGFGRETALEICKMGGNAVILDCREDRLQEVAAAAAELGFGDHIVWVVGDTSKYEDNVKLVDTAVEKFGRLDAFFANAGIMPLAPISEYEKALTAWEKCIDINFKGVLYGMIASYAQFKKQGYGHFLVTSSIHSNFPTNGAAVYSATKVAVKYMAQCLRNENPGLVKATVICPPGVPTNLYDTVVTPVGTSGIFGDSFAKYQEAIALQNSGEHPEFSDNASMKYLRIGAEELVWSVMYALNQPKGVSISEVQMHSANNYFQL
ncbi:MAG: SDR family oxidoreductase [Candidatus Scatomorpha sp.]|jgi:NADP-dependent 3-hydroxy acid dehydrogenase YdfG